MQCKSCNVSIEGGVIVKGNPYCSQSCYDNIEIQERISKLVKMNPGVPLDMIEALVEANDDYQLDSPFVVIYKSDGGDVCAEGFASIEGVIADLEQEPDDDYRVVGAYKQGFGEIKYKREVKVVLL